MIFAIQCYLAEIWWNMFCFGFVLFCFVLFCFVFMVIKPCTTIFDILYVISWLSYKYVKKGRLFECPCSLKGQIDTHMIPIRSWQLYILAKFGFPKIVRFLTLRKGFAQTQERIKKRQVTVLVWEKIMISILSDLRPSRKRPHLLCARTSLV